jgi:hypothetical protein
VIRWFELQDPDGNEKRWVQVPTSETQVTAERHNDEENDSRDEGEEERL